MFTIAAGSIAYASDRREVEENAASDATYVLTIQMAAIPATSTDTVGCLLSYVPRFALMKETLYYQHTTASTRCFNNRYSNNIAHSYNMSVQGPRNIGNEDQPEERCPETFHLFWKTNPRRCCLNVEAAFNVPRSNESKYDLVVSFHQDSRVHPTNSFTSFLPSWSTVTRRPRRS